MKKYIHFAKALKPQLTKEAADLIVEEYTRLRNQDMSQTDNQARVGTTDLREILVTVDLFSDPTDHRSCSGKYDSSGDGARQMSYVKKGGSRR